MLMTLSAAIACALLLSGLAKPALTQTGSREDSQQTCGTAPAPGVFGVGLHLFVARADNRVDTNVFQVPDTRTGWGDVPGNVVSGETGLTAALLGDQLSRAVTDVTDHIDVKVRKQPSALLITYVLKF